MVRIFDEDLEHAEHDLHTALNKGIKVARENNVNLSLFKRVVSCHLKDTNDEDDWTYEYGDYLTMISTGYISIIEFGSEYYGNRWNTKNS